MEWRWIKEFFISYIWEMFTKILIILVFVFGLFLNSVLLAGFRLGWFAANMLKLLQFCETSWAAATERAYSNRASYSYLIKLEQYERDK